jgi:PKD repeat protein
MLAGLVGIAGLLAIASFGAPSVGAAETYGELLRFGAAGTGQGQFTLTSMTHAFGVDQANESVYVGDEPQPGVYRVQELTSTGAFVAQTATFSPPHAYGIEGVAIDPTLDRLYVLALERRSTPETTIAVAGTLYAFSTVPTGETLQAASGTKAGVLSTPAIFLAHASPISRALAEPHGLAVDPTTHDVIVMGESETEEPESNPVVLQRVSSTTGALRARYATTALEREQASSPAVSAAGNVYVAQFDALYQVPSDFTSTTAPSRVANIREEPVLESERVLLQSPGSLLLRGGGLSFSPVGLHGEPEGMLIVSGGIFDEVAFYPGLIAFDALTGAETGWTGGANRRGGAETCTIGFQGPTYPAIAAGGKGNVYVLDPQYAKVIEFGPGGSGCPSAHDGELKALVGGAPLSGQIDEGTEVTFESNLLQANSVSVEWSFGEGEATPLTLAGDYMQHTEVTHTFKQSGEHLVTETIHTDNLATPTVQASAIVDVRVGKQPPTAVISGPIDVDVGAEAQFDGSASWDPNGRLGSTAITHYEWSFGDGSAAITAAPEVQHAYAAPGIYPASLTVEDSFGLKSEASSIPVTVQVPLPPLVHAPPPGGITGGAPLEASTKAPAPLVTRAPSKTLKPSNTLMPSKTPAPVARLASTLLRVTAGGLVNVVVSCSGAAGGCRGTLSLLALTPIKPERRGRARALRLGSASFSVAAGHQQALQIRLPSAARAFLAHNKALHAKATIVLHNPDGVDRTHFLIKLHIAVKELGTKGR